MLLTLVLIVHMCSTIHGYENLRGHLIELPLNSTCTDYKVKVTKYLAVAAGCYTSCTGANETPIDYPDERLCAVTPSQTEGKIPVRITGKCYNGTCMTPQRAPMPTLSKPFCSPPKTTVYNGESIATECTQFCNNGSSYIRHRYNVTDGLKCKKSHRTVGTCQSGTCSGEYTDECSRKKLAVFEEVNVDESCTLTCKNGSTIPLENGTMCAFRTTGSTHSIWKWLPGFSWTKTVEEIGVCKGGKCVKQDSYQSPKHQTHGCNGTDITIHNNLTVASPCTALCGDGKTEPRTEDILCLFQFHRDRKHDIYRIGRCHCGICEPKDNYVVLTERGNPLDYTA